MAKSNITKEKKVKKPAGAPPQIVIPKIEVRPYHRTEQDIPNWRRAIQSAESQIPRRNLLYNLYADVDLDGHVEAVTGKRRDPVKAANWQFVDKEGKPVEEINQVIDSIGFDNLLEEIINSRFWGYSILEPKFWKDDSDKWQMDEGLIPRLNYRPEIGVVSYDINGDDGINIREGMYAKTVMEVGKVKDLGLYMKAAPYAILKRGGWGDYAAFIQTFGTPLIDATWDGFDEKQRIQLNQALDEIGAGGTIIRPSGTTIEVIENKTSDTGSAHDKFISSLNKEISKALLGSTETTESSSSSGYAQSETHQDQDELKHLNDLAFTRKVLNSRFIRILHTFGFDTMGGEFVIQGEDQELEKDKSFEMHFKMAKDLGLPVDDDFWYETYGIPKPENYEQLKKEKEAATEQDSKEKEKAPDKTKKPLKEEQDDEEAEVNLKERNWFLKLFERFFVNAPAETTGAACGHHHIIKLAEDSRFDDDGLINRVWESRGNLSFDDSLFFHTADLLLKAFKKGWNQANKIELADAPGFIYGFDDPALLAAFEQNLFRFTGAKTLAEVQQLNQLFRGAESFEEFYQLAKKQTDIFNGEWLETEYTTAYLTGEASATYHRLIAQANIFPYWEYKTMGDHLVRPEHALIDGIILPYDDPRWKKLFPPNGWNCRCRVAPRMKHEFDESKLKAMRERADLYLESTQFKKEKAQGWGVNRATAGEVFSANQQYVNKFPGKAAKLLNKLKASDFGLKSYSQAKKVATAAQPEYTGTAKEFFGQLEKDDQNRILRDYHEKPLTIEAGRAKNINLLRALQDAIASPHEVWMNEKDLDHVTYLKYYQGKTFIARAKISNGATQLLNWFELEEKARQIEKVRRGLLVYRT